MRVFHWAGRLSLAAVLVTSFVGMVTPATALAASKVDQLASALLGDSSFKVRTQAALLLGKLGDKGGVSPLAKALEDDSKTVRAMAAQSLGKLGGEGAVSALKTLLLRESDAFVRSQAQKALASIEPLSRPQPRATKDRKIYLKFGPFTGGSKAADVSLLSLLRGGLRQSLERQLLGLSLSVVL